MVNKRENIYYLLFTIYDLQFTIYDLRFTIPSPSLWEGWGGFWVLGVGFGFLVFPYASPLPMLNGAMVRSPWLGI